MTRQRDSRGRFVEQKVIDRPDFEYLRNKVKMVFKRTSHFYTVKFYSMLFYNSATDQYIGIL